MRLAVIVADAGPMVYAGLDLTRTVKVFDLPDDIARYITKNRASHSTVTLALEDDDLEAPHG